MLSMYMMPVVVKAAVFVQLKFSLSFNEFSQRILFVNVTFKFKLHDWWIIKRTSLSQSFYCFMSHSVRGGSWFEFRGTWNALSSRKIPKLLGKHQFQFSIQVTINHPSIMETCCVFFFRRFGCLTGKLEATTKNNPQINYRGKVPLGSSYRFS